MKRQGLPSAKFSMALLATRYLALQELREKVRRAEERFASARLNRAPLFQTVSASDGQLRSRERKL